MLFDASDPSNIIIYATEECDTITGQLRFYCECIEVLNVNIQNTSPARKCLILSQIYTGEIDTNNGNFIQDLAISEAPRTKEGIYLDSCRFGLKFAGIDPSNIIVESLDSNSEVDYSRLHSEGILEIILRPNCQMVFFDEHTRKFTIEEIHIISLDKH